MIDTQVNGLTPNDVFKNIFVMSLCFCLGLQEINSNLQSYLHTGRDLNCYISNLWVNRPYLRGHYIQLKFSEFKASKNSILFVTIFRCIFWNFWFTKVFGFYSLVKNLKNFLSSDLHKTLNKIKLYQNLKNVQNARV